MDWEPPKQEAPGGGGGGPGLWGGKSASQLTLTDALMTGFRFLTKPNFILPILVIGVVVNLVVIAVFVPIILGIVLTGETAFGGAIVAAIVGGLIAAIVAGIVLNLYGLIWSVTASSGPEPTMQATFGLVGRRWINVLGAGVIVGVISLAMLLVIGIVAGLLGGIGLIVGLVGIVGAVYVGVRLSMASWLAADGTGAVESVQASWRLTQGKLLLIAGWGIVFAIVFGIIGTLLGFVLDLIPLIGPALTQTIGAAFGFGAGVSLYRRVKGS
jgi:hypothetical protein